MALPSRDVIKAALIRLLGMNGRMAVADVHDALSVEFNLTDADKSKRRGGQAHYKNEIRWARQELIQEGILAKPDEVGVGSWQLAGHGLRNPTDRADELETGATLVEGASQTVSVNRYERSSAARDACIAHHGESCIVCGLSFEQRYGPIGAHSIHVHHLVPLASIGHAYVLNPITDLVPICPNCHHIAHRRVPPFTVQELKAMLRSAEHGRA